MAAEPEIEVSKSESGLGTCLLWLVGGVSFGFLTILSLVLLLLLAFSISLNFYLGWQLAGLEVSISRSGTSPVEIPAFIPTSVLVAIPTQTPVLPLTRMPAPSSTISPVEIQLATLSALATEVAGSRSSGASAPATPTATPFVSSAVAVATPVALPTSVPTAVAISPPTAATSAPPPQDVDTLEPATPVEPEAGRLEVSPGEAQEFAPPATSSNSYELIPLDGSRESRPAEEHGDLNLKLRDPQPIEVELSLIDIPGAGSDPDAPQFSSVLEPNFVSAYTIHDWDWGCNCKGKLLKEDHLVLVGVKTTPGQPVFIPTKKQEIFQGKYYATLLYASEDSITFIYDRVGTVVKGYTVHYLGLQTDPNLLALFRESKGDQLPGLTLDTPVGTATDELIVAIRDNGKFMDARSRQDWWK
jgi:hypothetical protein